MTHAESLRATSLGASTLVIGGLLFLAATATTHVFLDNGATLAPPPYEMILPDPPVTPPPEPVREPEARPLRNLPAEGLVERLPDIVDIALPPVETSRAVGGGDGPVTISSPHWTHVPRDLAGYYPRRAISREVEGVVTLDCIVRVSGSLDCTPVSETPSGWGFAEAALRISRDYQMTPAMRGGVPVEGRYRMRVPFDIR